MNVSHFHLRFQTPMPKVFKHLHGHAHMKFKTLFTHAPDVDGIVLVNAVSPHVDMSFFYVTGLTSGLFEGCFAILHPDRMELLSSSLEEESARKGGFDVSIFTTKAEAEKLLQEKLSGFKRIGINADELTYSSLLKLKKYSNAEFVDVSDAIKKARLIKDAEEISRIRKACKIISETVREVPHMVREGMTELELAAEINYMMQKKGASAPAFQSLVCFGKNASEPHHASGETRLKKGDFVLCDVGAEYLRYVSDITRTFIFGEATPEQEAMYETVLEAQDKGLALMTEGREGREVHVTVKEFLDQKYKDRFIHGIGHSIGLSVHDGERMSVESEFTLKEGMVFTVEPGLYIPGWGGVRIEDNVVVKKGKPEILTSAPRELQII